MSYASISIDRRADYYARVAAVIAADPLSFYTRAEKGRQFQASRIAQAAGATPRPVTVGAPTLALVPCRTDIRPAQASPFAVRQGRRGAVLVA